MSRRKWSNSGIYPDIPIKDKEYYDSLRETRLITKLKYEFIRSGMEYKMTFEEYKRKMLKTSNKCEGSE